MPRENSFSDSDGRSLTPDLEDADNGFLPASPTYAASAPHNHSELHATRTRESARSRQTGSHPPPRTSRPPKDRFRYVVRKVIALNRGAAVMARRGVGAEPGIDPRQAMADAEYGWIKQQCVIEIADYSTVRCSFGRMTNCEFVDLMRDDEASVRPRWARVRWINIAGMSWDVIKAVSIKYDLHPLALEDVFHAHARARSKVDYYTQHLFLRVLCHELGEDSTRSADDGLDEPRRFISQPPGSGLQRRRPSWDITDMSAAANDDDEKRRVQEEALRALKSGERVNINVVPMCIFLFRDGTVITIHSTPSLEMTEPITRRLRQFDTMLRTSADASLLVQSLLGLIADKALEVVEAYKVKIKKFEHKIMMKPTIDTVRNLHILSADLILHRRTLGPIKTVVYGLRRYDVDRAAAVVEGSAAADAKVVGFMSHKSLTYLADVHDHLEHVLSQLDVIAGIGQNLVDYTFNMTSYEMNEVMRRLMLVTVIFLPLSLLTGYFGMNFENMWTVMHGHSDVIYWIIALPVMAIVVPLFVAPDMRRLAHYVHKRMLTKKVVKAFG
ncbi:hypothetical protein C8R47DRAFT_568707 [Mycena vitilis]|nr:hypothetical protein C8R47DRAFT_568707 [Mycena vitilis]